jgi:dihydroxyacetone kinase-like protein
MLSQADRDLGDGDHGMGMERGMRAAIEKLNAAEVESIEKAFSTVGMAMMSSMGGAKRRDLWHLLPQWRQSPQWQRHL